MASSTKRPRRARGSIDTLPSGALRVRVYAGIDPLTQRRHYLTEIVQPGLNGVTFSPADPDGLAEAVDQIGRASCRERV